MTDLTPITVSRGINARELQAKSAKRLVQEIVNEQIRLIDSEITTSHTNGANSIKHELPINFSINSMSKSDAQTLIYSELLLVYKNPISSGGKGFDNVQIDVGNESFLYINWINGMDAEERKQRMAYIRDCSVSRGFKTGRVGR